MSGIEFQIIRCAEKRENTTHCENNQSTNQNQLRPTQMLDLADKDIKMFL